MAKPFDLVLGGAVMDLTSSVGFCNAMHMVCCLEPGSGCMAAPVCGSWVFMTGLIKKTVVGQTKT